jgi:hypothetical protein
MKLKMFLTEKKRERKVGGDHLRCNLCHKLFRAASKYDRFCRTCKADEELFRFSEWLPAVGIC